MASFTDQLAKFFGMNETDTGLRELFISELKGIYYAEKQFADAQPQMAEAATTDVVRDAFEQHRAETQNQIRRIEQIFSSLGVAVDDMKCNAADGLVEDGQVVIANTESGSLTRDAGLIIAGQKVEHHEIAAYGSLHSLARLLGYHDAARLIEESLQEEKNTDRKLTEVAESFINERAKMETDGHDDMHSGMRSTVGDGDYGRTGSNYSGQVGSERSSDYSDTLSGNRMSDSNRMSDRNRLSDSDRMSESDRMGMSDRDYGTTGSTGNTGYGTGQGTENYADRGSYSSGSDSDDDRNRIRRTNSGGTDMDDVVGGSTTGV